jgi:hypothetical protein
VRQGIFRALADVIGQDVGEGVAQDPFVLAVTELQLDGQAHRKPDKRQIQDRHARFHALSHAGAVDAL